MGKLEHEVRDAIHGFILFDQLDKQIIDSQPMQRLRCVHQLAMCYQIYPGATHKRFERSLGVMETATRIFDHLFDRRLSDKVHERIADELVDERKKYWRRVVRLAGLLHDVGHLPFSHAAEKELLPEGWNHERITVEMIRHSKIGGILKDNTPQIDPEDMIDVAWDFEKREKTEPEKILSPWKILLNEIVCGNTFGADRIDYLLRDSWHAGVSYGRFDPDRLISGLTVLIDPDNEEIGLGLDIGAIHSAEALLLARYFMYTQVYLHDVRRIYDIHLKEFLLKWLPSGKFSSDWWQLIQTTDHEIIAAVRKAISDSTDSLYEFASRIQERKHFRTVYELVSTHKVKRPTIMEDIYQTVMDEFGQDHIRKNSYGPKSERNDFLVQTDGSVESSLQVSGVIAKLPPVEIGLIFANMDIPGKSNKVKPWIKDKIKVLLREN